MPDRLGAGQTKYLFDILGKIQYRAALQSDFGKKKTILPAHGGKGMHQSSLLLFFIIFFASSSVHLHKFSLQSEKKHSLTFSAFESHWNENIVGPFFRFRPEKGLKMELLVPLNQVLRRRNGARL